MDAQLHSAVKKKAGHEPCWYIIQHDGCRPCTRQAPILMTERKRERHTVSSCGDVQIVPHESARVQPALLLEPRPRALGWWFEGGRAATAPGSRSRDIVTNVTARPLGAIYANRPSQRTLRSATTAFPADSAPCMSRSPPAAQDERDMRVHHVQQHL